MKQLDFFLEPSSDYYKVGIRYENPVRNSKVYGWSAYSKVLKGINARDRIQVFLSGAENAHGTDTADNWNWGSILISHFIIVRKAEIPEV